MYPHPAELVSRRPVRLWLLVGLLGLLAGCAGTGGLPAPDAVHQPGERHEESGHIRILADEAHNAVHFLGHDCVDGPDSPGVRANLVQ